MDSNQMVDIKTEPKINEGIEILKILDTTRYKPSSFFWFYLREGNVWRLIVSSPLFDTKDSQEYYSEFINEFKNEKSINDIGLENITLLPTQHDLIILLKKAIKTYPDSISDIRFTSNTINNVFIDDAYIYRIS